MKPATLINPWQKFKDADAVFSRKGLKWHPVTGGPLKLTGFPWYSRDKAFVRLPLPLLSKVNERLHYTAHDSTGGTLRFRTDSRRIVVNAKFIQISGRDFYTFGHGNGFDAYRGSGKNREIFGVIHPGRPVKSYQAALKEELPPGMNEWTLYFPTESKLHTLSIGLDTEADVLPPTPFTNPDPVVFYGSSIVHGASTSRNGNTYPARVARRLNTDFINLGFGGSAEGQTSVAREIAKLKISAFVLDYDHNAQSPENLEKTHFPFYQIVRKAHPKIPMVVMTACNYYGDPDLYEPRAQIIRASFEKARKAGDRNIYFLDGKKFFGKLGWDDYTMDRLHPNDQGFGVMADAVVKVLKKAMK